MKLLSHGYFTHTTHVDNTVEVIMCAPNNTAMHQVEQQFYHTYDQKSTFSTLNFAAGCNCNAAIYAILAVSGSFCFAQF